MTSEIVPYSSLGEPRTVVLFGKVPLTVRLCEVNPNFCLLSVPSEFVLEDITSCPARVPVGTTIHLEYRGTECAFRVGRPIRVLDA